MIGYDARYIQCQINEISFESSSLSGRPDRVQLEV